MNETQLGYEIKGAIYDTYFSLGPGLLEKTYQKALCYFLNKRGLKYQTELSVPVIIEGHNLGSDLRIDILVENCYVLELKAVEEMRQLYHSQILTYMRLGHFHRGYLVNFNCEKIKDNIFPKVNGCFEKDKNKLQA